MKNRLQDLRNLRVTIMGLGLHGGGLASALFFTRRGSRVTVTDLQDERSLKPCLDQLREFNVHTVLGKHDERDFIETDLIIKNPAVPENSVYLQLARSRGVPVETDLSIFLRLSDNPIIAVTGSKGKSTACSAIHHCLLSRYPGARVGGNITVSPLSFLHQLHEGDPVVLELSSWQLADLKGKELLIPRVSVMTAILPDHQDRYPDMKSYIADKKVIFQAQGPEHYAVLNFQDPFQKSFAGEIRARLRYFSNRSLPEGIDGAFLKGKEGFIKKEGKIFKIFKDISLPGAHNRMNLLAAGLACSLFSLDHNVISGALITFKGIEHRLEYFLEKNGIKFYNDSSSTIPEATGAALKSLKTPIILIAGGTDKNIDFTPLLEVISIPERIILLEGSATFKIIELFEKEGITYSGPFKSLGRAVRHAYAEAVPGTSILFSPGCTSFGMFLNEFDRGRQFKDIVHALKPAKK